MVINRNTRSDGKTLEVCRPEEKYSPLLILERDEDGRTRDKIVVGHEEIGLVQATIQGEPVFSTQEESSYLTEDCENCEGVSATATVAGMDLCSTCAVAAKRRAREVFE
jgi:hypothetical protein